MALDEVSVRLPIDKINNMETINNKVLIEVFDDRSYVNGIFVPITDDNPFIPNDGIVFKVCGGEELNFHVGDHVVFEKYKGKRIFSDDNRQFILIDKDHILAIVLGGCNAYHNGYCDIYKCPCDACNKICMV